ncbi:MAG TPA: ABC transporter permease [Gemmatimonadaceae bacterium]|nr:ABC transporter permease [Gemmatimonadaceae bacterium]
MSIWSDLRERLHALVFRAQEEREMAEEMQYHMEMAGRQAFGNIERYKEDVRDARGTRLIEETIADAGWSLRTLIKRPRFAVLAIATLALGIGGTTAVFSVVDAVLLKPLPYAQPEQLVRVYTWYATPASAGGRTFLSTFHFKGYRDHVTSFQSAAALHTYDVDGADIDLGAGAERIRLLPVSAGYFATLRSLPSLGRPFDVSEENGAHLVILSHRFWQQRFRGDPRALGRVLTMNGVPHTIVGIGPDGLRDPIVGEVDAWTPIDLSRPDYPGNHWLTMIARLTPGTTIDRAQSEVDAVQQALVAEAPRTKNAKARLDPLKADVVGSAGSALELVFGAVGLVLLLVCVNVANLLLVRASERSPEFALRTALGARRSRLVRQLLTESAVLALSGGAVGLGLAWVVMRGLVTLGASSVPRLEHLSLDPRMLIFCLVISAGSAITFGLVPALRGAVGAARSGNSRQGNLRAGLVVVQVALAFVLLVGAGLLLASIAKLRDLPLGVQSDHVLTFRVELPDALYDSTARAKFYETLAQRLAQEPGVRTAGGISKLPATGSFNEWGVRVASGPLAGADSDYHFLAQNRVVSGNYFAAARIPVLAGRTFDDREQPLTDSLQPRHIVLSQLAAQRFFPGIDPIGQRIGTGGPPLVVIGVVGDVAVDATGQSEAYIYHPHRQFAGDRNWQLTQVVLTDVPPMDVLPLARRALAALDPRLVVDQPMALDDAIGRGTAQRVFTMRVLLTFAAVALALAAVGLFGILSYVVTLRRKEIGIRIALGADRGSIRAMVLRHGIAVTALGIAFGLLGALALSRLIASLLFGTSPLDPKVLAGAVVFMLVVAAAAAYFPARRATSVDPRLALQAN